MAAIRSGTPLASREILAAFKNNGPFQTVADASKVIGASRSKIYQLAHEGTLVLAKLGGRTLVETKSLVDYLQTAEPWSPSGRTTKAVASRRARAEASRREFAA